MSEPSPWGLSSNRVLWATRCFQWEDIKHGWIVALEDTGFQHPWYRGYSLNLCKLVQVSRTKEQRIDSGEESQDVLEEVFSKIQAVTGEDNLDLLVTRFIQGKSVRDVWCNSWMDWSPLHCAKCVSKVILINSEVSITISLSERKLACTALFLLQFVVEDQKFALFNFVNDQNNEADVLKEEISQVGICFLLLFCFNR